MNLKFILAFFFPALIYSCNPDTTKWQHIKKTMNVYPKDSMVSYISYPDGYPARKWINEAYKNYEFKRYCTNTVEVTFELSTPRVRSYLYQDTFSIAKLLQKEFQKNGVAHFVGQKLSNGELKIYLYHEDKIEPVSTLFSFIIPNTGMIKSDPDWKTYATLFLEN